MPRSWIIRSALAVALCLAAGWPAAPATRAQQVEEVGPDLFYLQDEAGRLVPVPGFRYRDFVDLMRLKDGLPGQPEPPAAVLETITVTATIPAAAATPPRRCPATIDITIRQTRSGWASLPVDLQGLVVSEPPRHDGPGQMLFTVDGGAAADPLPRDGASLPRGPAGYRIWLDAQLDGAEAVRHTVSIVGTIAVDASPSHETVSVVLPPATASRVVVRTLRSEPAASVRPAALPLRIDPLGPADASGARSEVTVVGASGPLQIRISDRDAPAELVDAIPECVVDSVVRVDGKTALIEATLRFDRLPRDVATVRVMLPAKATLRTVQGPAALVERGGSPESPEAVIRVDRDADGRAVVELQCEQAVDSSGRVAFESLGFAVADIPAWRQRGRTSLFVDGEWQVEWDDGGPTRRIDPPLTGRRPGFVAAFAYDAQPASLPLRVRPRGSRMVVEPEYRYEVAAARVTLDGRLRVSVRGAPASRLVIDIGDWDVEEVGPSAVVDAAGVAVNDGRLVIPFQQGLAGDAVIDMRCSRPLDRAAERVQWKIPAPQAGLVGPAAVLIVTESDIELLPDSDAIRGLVRQVAPVPVRSDAERIVLAYRLDGGEGVFAAQRRFLPRRIDAALTAKVEIDETRTFVTETIRFSVTHVPLEFIDLMVPAVVDRSGTLEVRQGGQLLNPVDEESAAFDAGEDDGLVDDEARDDGAADDAAARRLRALLPVPLLGTGELVVTFAVPTPSVPPETTVAEDLPLVVPTDARIGRQSLQMTVGETLAVDVRGETWKRDAATPGLTAVRAWTAPRFQDVVPLAIAARRQDASSETIVEAAWLQTRLLAGRREDIYRYAISTAAERLSLVLPAALITGGDGRPDPGLVEVRLDGRPVAGAVRSDGRVGLDLAPGRGRKTVLLEVQGSRPRNGTERPFFASPLGVSRVVLEAPEFPEGLQQRRFYWEVHLPPDDHVLVPPGRWLGQQRWTWAAIGLEHTPVVSHAVLDEWVRGNAGRSESDDREPDAALVSRRAVYSGVGPPGSEVMWVAPTWLVVLMASGPALAIGLSLIYWPWARSVPAVLAMAVLLTAAATLAPGLVPLVLQSALPGMALAAVAGLMRAFVTRPGAWRDRGAAAPAASSLTRVAAPSIIVSSSAARSVDGITTSGRSAS